MKLTVDASIVVKWYISEKYSEESRLLLAHRLERYAPDILLAEFANTIWKKARRQEIAEPQGYFDGFSNLREVIVLYSGGDHIERAAQISVEINHPVYDCLYLACAEATESKLITADQKLGNKVVDNLLDINVGHIGAHSVTEEISAAATALVIGRGKVEELVADHDRLVETGENVRFSLIDQRGGLLILDSEERSRIFNSPAGKRLEGLFLKLNDEERVDLLALGWLGKGHPGAEWRPIFERACTMIDGYATNNWRYVLGLGAYWRDGFQRLTGISI